VQLQVPAAVQVHVLQPSPAAMVEPGEQMGIDPPAPGVPPVLVEPPVLVDPPAPGVPPVLVEPPVPPLVPPVAHARSVHAQTPSTHSQVLHPSSASASAPSLLHEEPGETVPPVSSRNAPPQPAATKAPMGMAKATNQK
jgi:hypothetical protein